MKTPGFLPQQKKFTSSKMIIGLSTRGWASIREKHCYGNYSVLIVAV